VLNSCALAEVMYPLGFSADYIDTAPIVSRKPEKDGGVTVGANTITNGCALSVGFSLNPDRTAALVMHGTCSNGNVCDIATIGVVR
jgi:hypothetical protein